MRARLELNHARGIRNEGSQGRGTHVKEECWSGQLEVDRLISGDAMVSKANRVYTAGRQGRQLE